MLVEYESIYPDRIYDEISEDRLDQFDFDPELMGAWLLGMDARQIVDEPSHGELLPLLTLDSRERLARTAQAVPDVDGGRYGRCIALMSAFEAGYMDRSLADN